MKSKNTFMTVMLKTTALSFLISIVASKLLYGQNQVSTQIQLSNFQDDLIVDSLLDNYNTTDLINNLRQRIVGARQTGDQLSLADAYFDIARSYNTIGYFESSEEHYLKALEIYKAHNAEKKIDILLNALVKVYANNHNHGANSEFGGRTTLDEYKSRKYDSLQPIALKFSKKLNSEQVFLNYESQALNSYFFVKPDSLLAISDRALTGLSKLRLENLNLSSNIDPERLKKRLQLEFTYSKAISLLKVMWFNEIDPYNGEGYRLIFSIDPEEYAEYIIKDNEYFSRLSALNLYRARYYKEYNINKDSAYKYMRLSDINKYKAILNYRKRLATNGTLIHQITKAEENLTHANTILLKDKEIAANYKYMLIFAGCLILALSGFLFHYYRSKRKIELINRELHDSNDKLKSLDKERLNFFSVLSHELRTPVYGISGLTEMLLEEKDERQKTQNLKSLKLSINYIMFLINNVLQFSKFSNTTTKPTMQTVDIRELINSTLDTVRVFARSKNLQLKLVAEKLPQNPLSIDKTSLKQVLINLIYNAIKFTPSGTVTLRVTEKERSQTGIVFLFEVIDEGVGISPEDQTNLFEAYRTIGKDITNSGTGLGLHIVKSLLQINSSDIKLTSQAGVGSNFYFKMAFPYAITPKHDQTDHLLVGTELKKVLIVDDNKINLMVSKKNVERLGNFTAETALSGAEGIAKAKVTHYDLILMDINMPEIDGFEATNAIRQFNKQVPIIALTALNFNDVQKQSIKVGMNAIITKPYGQDEFKKTIFHYCREIAVAVS